jgi:predicted nucleic acid-binding protein
MSNPPKAFIDSNVLIYANDKDEVVKQRVAIEALDELWTTSSGVLSVQVLEEFYSVVTRKLKTRASRALAQEVVQLYSQWCEETTAREIQAAFRIESITQISFWDALIVASAAQCGATRILSEDLNHGQIIDGIEIVNPFRDIE